MTTAEVVTSAEVTDFSPAMMHLGELLNGSMVVLGLDVGHRAGLFELAAKTGPATSDELATAGGVSERPLREWLGLMTVGGVISYEPATQRYTLPDDFAALLTDASTMNLAAAAEAIARNAAYVPHVVRSIHDGAGIAYAEFPEFVERMDALSRQLYDAQLVDGYLAGVPGLTDRLAAGVSVADIGCGSGHCVNLLGRAFPHSTFVGFDFAEDAIAAARREADEWQLANVRFDVRDVADLPAGESFDFVTAFDSIHDQARPRQVLAGIRRVLADGGVFVMVDPLCSSLLEENAANPLGPWIYGTSLFHCMQVSLAQGGEALGTAYGEQTARALLAEAGFGTVELVPAPPTDVFNGIWHCRA